MKSLHRILWLDLEAFHDNAAPCNSRDASSCSCAPSPESVAVLASIDLDPVSDPSVHYWSTSSII